MLQVLLVHAAVRLRLCSSGGGGAMAWRCGGHLAWRPSALLVLLIGAGWALACVYLFEKTRRDRSFRTALVGGRRFRADQAHAKIDGPRRCAPRHDSPLISCDVSRSLASPELSIS